MWRGDDPRKLPPGDTRTELPPPDEATVFEETSKNLRNFYGQSGGREATAVSGVGRRRRAAPEVWEPMYYGSRTTRIVGTGVLV